MLMKDFYLDTIRYEMSSLAHYIYHLLGEQKISLEDDSSKIDLVKADPQIVKELIQKNVLGINKMCVYSLKMNHLDNHSIEG